MAGKRYDPTVVEQFFVLLRSGLYDKRIDSFPELTEGEWESILSIAKEQTVTGMIYSGVNNLPENYKVPESISLRLMLESSRIEKRSYKVLSVCKELFSLLRDNGLHPIVMKGPSVAKFYPKPSLRESGDLDLYIRKEEFEKAVTILGEASFTLPDGSLHYNWKGVDIDLHRHYFDLHVSEDKLPKVPSPYATLVLLSSHILKHCMGPGIGLRQLCDMAVAYRSLCDEKVFQNENMGKSGPVDKEVLLSWYEKAGILKWNALLSSFLKENLGGDGYPFNDENGDGSGNGSRCTFDGKALPSPSPLLEIVLEGGDFGHHAVEREAALGRGPLRRKINTAWMYLKKVPFSMEYAPDELMEELGELAFGNLKKFVKK